MNELDIVDRLSLHRTMGQYLTIDQLIFALNCDRAAAKIEIEALRIRANRHEAEIAVLRDELEKAKAVSVPEGPKTNPEAPKPNDKHVFVLPDASMTKIRYIFVDGEMVYENLESEQ